MFNTRPTDASHEYRVEKLCHRSFPSKSSRLQSDGCCQCWCAITLKNSPTISGNQSRFKFPVSRLAVFPKAARLHRSNDPLLMLTQDEDLLSVIDADIHDGLFRHVFTLHRDLFNFAVTHATIAAVLFEISVFTAQEYRSGRSFVLEQRPYSLKISVLTTRELYVLRDGLRCRVSLMPRD